MIIMTNFHLNQFNHQQLKYIIFFADKDNGNATKGFDKA